METERDLPEDAPDWETPELPMSPQQRDLPLWTRGVAIVLLPFASWWLFNTESVRNVVGDSIGHLCLGVVTVSMLRGMHLPSGFWPNGPWRRQFSVVAVVASAAIIAVLMAVSRLAGADALKEQVDPGTFITVVAGAVALSFGVGFVKQVRFLGWYALSVGLGILPFIVELTMRYAGVTGDIGHLCFFVMRVETVGGNGVACTIAMVPALSFLTAAGVASAIATEEIAFRRLLIGVTPRAGMVAILASSFTAFCWYVVLFTSGVGGSWIVICGTLGAISAGCIYAISQSLIASALFSGTYAAGYRTLALANSTIESRGADGAFSSPAALIAASVVALALTVALVRKHGFLGNLKEVK